MSILKTKTFHNLLITLALLAYIVVTIVPFYFMLVRAFVPTKDAATLHLWIPPEEPFNMESEFGNMAVYFNLDIDEFKTVMGIDGYINPNQTMAKIAQKYSIPEEKILGYMQPFLRYNGLLTMMKNGFVSSFFATVFVTLTIILVGGFLTAMTGSVLARFRKKWHQGVYNLYIFSMIIPVAVTMLPTYLIMTRYLGLYDNYLALILLGIQGGAIPVMIFTSYIGTFPEELMESVSMDGGTRFTYFGKILLPNLATPFASFVAIMLPNVWNNLMNAVLYLKPEHQTLMALINTMNGTYATNFQAMYSGLLLSMVPLLLVYLVFQNLFVKSAMVGAIKG